MDDIILMCRKLLSNNKISAAIEILLNFFLCNHFDDSGFKRLRNYVLLLSSQVNSVKESKVLFDEDIRAIERTESRINNAFLTFLDELELYSKVTSNDFNLKQSHLSGSTILINPTCLVEVSISKDINDFSEHDQILLLKAFGELLKMEEKNIRIINKRAGSTIITFELPFKHAEILEKKVNSALFNLLNIQKIMMLPSPIFLIARGESMGLLIALTLKTLSNVTRFDYGIYIEEYFKKELFPKVLIVVVENELDILVFDLLKKYKVNTEVKIAIISHLSEEEINSYFYENEPFIYTHTPFNPTIFRTRISDILAQGVNNIYLKTDIHS